MIKIWLDDERDAPDKSWTIVRSSKSFVILVLNHWGKIAEISFDNDLGEDVWEGKDCLELVIHLQTLDSVGPYKLSCHSANTEARRQMGKGIETYDQMRFKELNNGKPRPNVDVPMPKVVVRKDGEGDKNG